ncbi:MAG: cytochrome C oxidase subunit I [Bacteroidetes bacterium]|nr:cytochrome C oxidase subunit I [Bacteroidota bacterium]
MIMTDIPVKTTHARVIIPFYVYAGISFLAASITLLFSTEAFHKHYFHPHLLAITHLMAIGWGTMIIMGASYQLVPVVAEGKLYSDKLAYASFVLAAVGLPLLVISFFEFDMGSPAKWGGRLLALSVICYLFNIGKTIVRGKSENVHATFIFTAVVWLLITFLFGLALVYNFTYPIFPHDSIHYLPLHAHAGVVGWFLLLVMGVGSRLIPMFLISKYTNARLLWIIYYCLNGALISYIFIFYFAETKVLIFGPGVLLLLSIVLFVVYCLRAYHARLRKQVDAQMNVSMLSVWMMGIPVILLFAIIVSVIVTKQENISLVLAYGFMIFFGWITAIILGMTFKTLPFIVWNQIRHRYTPEKLPSPKDLVHSFLFRMMSVCYLAGFILFAVGILWPYSLLLPGGACLLVFAAVFYNLNVLKIVTH